jgi:NAD(P)-dependent dehydrogenase (short-subunit alcohol dehydrogenase family)
MMASDSSMSGRVALVTGAASGIEKATALAFARRSAKVMLADIDNTAGRALAAQMDPSGERVRFVRRDVADEQQVGDIVAETLRVFERIDDVVNHAGVEGPQALLVDSEQADWDRVLAVNLCGVELCMKHQLAVMLRQGGGAIVNMASIAGLVGFPRLSAYVASKLGIVGLPRAAALEYASRGIRINAICPGPIRTPMLDRIFGADSAVAEQIASQVPMARVRKPEEVAEAVVWLSSESAAYVTGHALTVDGGWVAK